MGYLNSTTTPTVDAILTKKGRELLSMGGQNFNITQFAIADDEVDYNLYTTAHPLGTNYYGAVIENMPILEASVDETQSMRSKLVSLARGTNQIPIITIGTTNIILTAGVSNAQPISPNTTSGLNGAGFGYTAVLFNSDAAILTGTGLTTGTAPSFFGDTTSANATVATGLSFTITPRDVQSQIQTQLVIYGNQTGASISIPVIVNPKPTTL